MRLHIKNPTGMISRQALHSNQHMKHCMILNWVPRKKQVAITWAATFYYMLYNNQLVLTGKINDVGSYTRTNVPNSYRTGIELQGGVVVNKWLNATANLTFKQK